ncbi:MAG TPA: adenylate/guanylate cyclase domain-containing protein, partial [Polyangiaceae bacterium]
MKLRFTTVRAKLTALVAFSAIVSLTALPVLSWIMDRQLVDEMHERVPGALRGFGLELDDDLRDLSTIVEQLSSQADVTSALRSKNAPEVLASGAIFHASYPDIDLLFFDASGKHLAQIEVDAPPRDASTVPELGSLGMDQTFRGVVEHGCETSATAPPAFVVAHRVRDVGMIVGCIPLDSDYLADVKEKVGVELAFVAPGGTAPIDNTSRFPVRNLSSARAESTLVENGNEDWALARVAPPSMRGQRGNYAAVIALDVTDVRNIVRRHLFWAVGVLAAATLVSLLLGARLASVMSRALSRVNAALQKLQQHEYTHVDMIHTGDELEDLATGFNTMVDGLKERDKLRTTFGKYMTQTVMDHLMSGKVQLGGETLTVTILFSDIRSFTTMSEEMNDAQALVRLLNEYFTEMVSIVMQEDGVVDKYIGDAI